ILGGGPLVASGEGRIWRRRSRSREHRLRAGPVRATAVGRTPADAGRLKLAVYSAHAAPNSRSLEAKHHVGKSLVGWPREIPLPELPQIRTCEIPASGSSSHEFAAVR